MTPTHHDMDGYRLYTPSFLAACEALGHVEKSGEQSGAVQVKGLRGQWYWVRWEKVGVKALSAKLM